MRPARVLSLLLVLAAGACAQAEPWPANWISVSGSSPHAYGVYHFRRTFELEKKPAVFRIRVTADNRYKLYVNGQFAGLGPARGDLHHWRYETYDIAPMLRAGRNVLAAVVWNAGTDAPMAQITDETGFLLAGDSAAERMVDTPKGWKCIRDEAYAPEPVPRALLPYGYYVAGPGDRVDGSRYPWGWEQPGFDDSAWLAPAVGDLGGPREAMDMHSRKMLVPRSVPMEEMPPQRLARVRSATGITVPEAFPAKPVSFEVPAGSEITLLLDNDQLTTAYPALSVSGGAGAEITLRYTEALYVPGTSRKDNRNEVAGKSFYGYQDVFLPDGGSRRLFQPLWWRTYRYLLLKVKTSGAPLTIHDLHAVFTGYPFERRAQFKGGPPEIQRFLDVGWRTARLCAHETYMDCPYYEQLQYAGDTRIQALVSVYMSGDTRLMRNAIEQLDSSRGADGLTYSRAPTRLQQYIPPFSLWWIGMVHDYWMYADDPLFVREMLPGVRAVLTFFAGRQKPDGSLGLLPWWNYVDWTREWTGGVPPRDVNGSSAPLDLQLLLAYDWASELETALGSKAQADEYARRATQLRQTIQKLYWDPARQLYTDAPKRKQFSQHAQALAILAHVVEGENAGALIDRTLADPSLVQCSIYFRYYLHAAAAEAGRGDRYLDLLDEWRGQLSRGLTTWAESFEPARSDCHAWGSSPNVELFRTVLGIDSAAPGFRRVRIRPNLGALTEVSGVVPHPKGEIAVAYTKRGGRLEATITLPAGVEGELVWRGERRQVTAGTSKFVLGR